MRELKLKKCLNCGALVEVIQDCKCACNFICCDEVMHDVLPNSVDASIEKHIPNVLNKQNEIEVTVDHVMEEDHYIEWITFVTDNKKETIYFKPNDVVKAVFPKQSGIVYSYCNKHGLWKKEI